jgi:hypothetical protein
MVLALRRYKLRPFVVTWPLNMVSTALRLAAGILRERSLLPQRIRDMWIRDTCGERRRAAWKRTAVEGGRSAGLDRSTFGHRATPAWDVQWLWRTRQQKPAARRRDAPRHS